jgi:hypothetical protein
MVVFGTVPALRCTAKGRCTASRTRDQFVFFASPRVSITLRSDSVISTTNFL